MTTLRCQPPGEPASEIRIGRGLRRQLAAAGPGFALVDARADALDPGLWPAPRQLVAGGEALKTFAALEQLLRALAQAGVDRRGRLCAVGGGTVGDLGGLAASLYLRGIELWQVPTTLLAMVDSAVGGKTAINLPEGKNLVGSVHPAALVAIDLDYVRGQPEADFRAGLAEALKVAIGLDPELFELLLAAREPVLARDPSTLAAVVERSVTAKIAVVEGDLREHGRRRLLNLGHTLGHALEAQSGWQLAHGLAVARGLHFALDLAEALAAIDAGDAARCRGLLQAYGFAATPLPAAAALAPFIGRDKKVAGAELHFALPVGIGRSEVRALPVARVLQQLTATAQP